MVSIWLHVFIAVHIIFVNFITTSTNDINIDDGECKLNCPKLAQHFRLVNYCNLPVKSR